MKWHLPSSTAAEHRGKTDKALVRDHKAIWEYRRELPVRLTIDKAHNLESCEIYFEILQEYYEGGKGRVHLGNVKLNLAEYVDADFANSTSSSHGGADRNNDRELEAEPDQQQQSGITRRYLMQDSKINSTLRVTIHMHQTEGDTNYIVPPLKSAAVFAGIAGIISTEAADGGRDDMPILNTKTRELTEMQDVYRRTLAATWSCPVGELAPDKLIEDLFAGGDGGRMQPPQPPGRTYQTLITRHPRDESVGSGSTSDSESRRTITPHHLSPVMARHGHVHEPDQGGIHRRFGSRSQDSPSSPASRPHHERAVSGVGSMEQHIQHHGHHGPGAQHGDGRRRQNGVHREVTEFDIREDLRSWQIKAR